MKSNLFIVKDLQQLFRGPRAGKWGYFNHNTLKGKTESQVFLLVVYFHSFKLYFLNSLIHGNTRPFRMKPWLGVVMPNVYG
jgi:hypothetical protein